MNRAQKREHLIEVASELFKRLGYHAAGVDRVIAEAGIAKTTLYRHFGSKEGLIVEVLRRIDEKSRDDMRRTVEAARDPRRRLLATFDYLENWFKEKTFYGCPFMGAASEYNTRASPVFQEAMLHKRLVIAYFEELARAAGLRSPKRVAEEVNLLHEGATAVAQITGDPSTARRAKDLAARLIEEGSSDSRSNG
jgi:AcrR family transcriptional regulator